MKESVLNRVLQLYESVSNGEDRFESKFAKMIGSNPKTLNQQLKGDRTISLDTILNILSSFEELSSEWLLRGKGDMNLSLSNYNGEENDEILDIKTKYDKLRIEYDEEIIEHQKLLSQLEYMEEYNQRLVLEVHNLKKKLSAYEREKKDIV